MRGCDVNILDDRIHKHSLSDPYVFTVNNGRLADLGTLFESVCADQSYSCLCCRRLRGAIGVLRNFSNSPLQADARELRFTPDGWNSNDIALALALAIPFALYLATRHAGWLTKWLARGYLILGPLAIILTSSRSGLTVTLIALSAFPLYFLRQTAAAKLLMVLVLICAGCVTWYYAPHQSWDRLSTICSSVVAGDLNGRELIWLNGPRTFCDNVLVGVGAGNFLSSVGANFTAHNTFLAVLVEQGLLGFTVFSTILGGAAYGISLLKGDEPRMCFFLLLCWAVGAFTLGWAASRVTWFVLGLIVTFGHAEHSDSGALSSEFPHGDTLLATSRL